MLIAQNARFIALQNDEKGQGPLASYFKGEVLNGRDTDIFTSNMCEVNLYLHSYHPDRSQNRSR